MMVKGLIHVATTLREAMKPFSRRIEMHIPGSGPWHRAQEGTIGHFQLVTTISDASGWKVIVTRVRASCSFR